MYVMCGGRLKDIVSGLILLIQIVSKNPSFVQAALAGAGASSIEFSSPYWRWPDFSQDLG